MIMSSFEKSTQLRLNQKQFAEIKIWFYQKNDENVH